MHPILATLLKYALDNRLESKSRNVFIVMVVQLTKLSGDMLDFLVSLSEDGIIEISEITTIICRQSFNRGFQSGKTGNINEFCFDTKEN